MIKSPIIKKIICSLLVVSLLAVSFSGCSSENDTKTAEAEEKNSSNTEEIIYAERNDNYKKTETVYVTLNNAGETQDITVTDWLHTDKAETYLCDVTDLENVRNTKTDTEPSFNDGGLFWNMPTTDLYYRGTSTKTLPVSFSIKYFIDDTEISAGDIAGKSGKLKIEIKMVNNLYKTQKIDGKEVKIYNPVLALGGMILPETNFQNISVTNGMSVGDGSKEIAVVAGFPGMNETLGLDKIKAKESADISFADSFEITADVTDFSLGNMYFAVLPLSAVTSEIEVPTSVDDLKSSINQLKEIEYALQTLDPNNVIAGLMRNPEKISELASMVSDAVTLYENNKVVLELLSKYMTTKNIETLQGLFSGSQDSELHKFVALLSEPAVQQFLKLMPSVSGELGNVLPLLKDLAADMEDPAVQKALENLPETTKKLNQIQGQLNNNQDLINGLSTLLNSENIDKLSDLMNSVNAADFSSKLQKYGFITDNSDELLAKISAMLEYGKTYKIYTQVADNVQSSVMFIMKTPSIKKAEIKETKAVTEEKNWLQKLFSKD